MSQTPRSEDAESSHLIDGYERAALAALKYDRSLPALHLGADAVNIPTELADLFRTLGDRRVTEEKVDAYRRLHQEIKQQLSCLYGLPPESTLHANQSPSILERIDLLQRLEIKTWMKFEEFYRVYRSLPSYYGARYRIAVPIGA